MHEILKILSSKIQQINVRFVSYASYLLYCDSESPFSAFDLILLTLMSSELDCCGVILLSLLFESTDFAQPEFRLLSKQIVRRILFDNILFSQIKTIWFIDYTALFCLYCEHKIYTFQ